MMEGAPPPTQHKDDGEDFPDAPPKEETEEKTKPVCSPSWGSRGCRTVFLKCLATYRSNYGLFPCLMAFNSLLTCGLFPLTYIEIVRVPSVATNGVPQ